MAWTDSQGHTYRHRRPNGWPTDDKCPDGALASGWRRVVNGRVRFAQEWWVAPELAALEGRFIRVQSECPYWTKANGWAGAQHATPENMGETLRSFYEGKPIRLEQEKRISD